MNELSTEYAKSNRDLKKTIGLSVAAAVIAGTVGINAANAATSSPTPSATSGSTTGAHVPDNDGDGPKGGPGMHGSASVRSDETVLTGSDLDKAKAAAEAAVPGATIFRAETDAGDAEYEVHVTKADGTDVTVKLDANFKLIEVQDGMGKGDPAPAGAPAPSVK